MLFFSAITASQWQTIGFHGANHSSTSGHLDGPLCNLSLPIDIFSYSPSLCDVTRIFTSKFIDQFPNHVIYSMTRTLAHFSSRVVLTSPWDSHSLSLDQKFQGYLASSDVQILPKQSDWGVLMIF